MKTKLSLLLAILVLLPGCDWFKNATEVTIPTSLTLDIPVVMMVKKATTADPKVAIYDFSASGDLALADNEDVAPYLEKIRKINLNSLVVTVNGLGATQTINTISLAVDGVGTISTQTGITAANNSFTPVIDGTLLTAAETKFKTDRKITVTVTGNTNQATSFSVNLDFDAEIVAGALD